MNNICYGLKDKVVIVTGGSRGIGLEIARRLLGEGAKVAICGRKSEGLDAAADILGGGDNLMTFQAHIAKEADVDSLFDAVIDRFFASGCAHQQCRYEHYDPLGGGY